MEIGNDLHFFVPGILNLADDNNILSQYNWHTYS